VRPTSTLLVDVSSWARSNSKTTSAVRRAHTTNADALRQIDSATTMCAHPPHADAKRSLRSANARTFSEAS
jgi:hypothetical protein